MPSDVELPGDSDAAPADFGESAPAVVALAGVVDASITVEHCVVAVENLSLIHI